MWAGVISPAGSGGGRPPAVEGWPTRGQGNLSIQMPEGQAGVVYNRIWAKALPEADFKHRSNAKACFRSVKAIAVLMRYGVYVAVWGAPPEF